MPRVEIQHDEPGTGERAERGKTVVVRFDGYLRRGDAFARDQVVQFRIGSRDVIAGLEYGVEGMRVGGRRGFLVPPHLGYRSQGVAGRIPPDALLRFEVELLEVKG
jgi:FKBP-type peptidyl-prolyl cis-trans isomerase